MWLTSIKARLLELVDPHPMQYPTHPRLHLRDAHDAHIVFEAVRQGFLKPISRRLNEMERTNLVRSGAVFVWFEAEDESGLMRWTGMFSFSRQTTDTYFKKIFFS
jgi:hypothetical protein